MNIEQQVCSLELSKKLKELGVQQNGYFVWRVPKDSFKKDFPTGFKPNVFPIGFISTYDDVNDNHPYRIDCSAFTVAELGEMLPDCINASKLFNNGNTKLLDLNGHYIKSQKKDDEYKIYIDCLTKVVMFISKNEANARAQMLIYLIENGLMKNVL